MDVRMYASEGHWMNRNFSHILHFDEEDGCRSCTLFQYWWGACEWKDEYSALKEMYKSQLADYRNWTLSKPQYLHHIKHMWLERAPDFVEELCSGERKMVPLDLRKNVSRRS